MLDNYKSNIVILQQNLARTDDDSWKEREAAVLSIGAIAEGCITGLYPHLPQVILITNQRCILSPTEHNSSLLGYGRNDRASIRTHAMRQIILKQSSWMIFLKLVFLIISISLDICFSHESSIT